VKTRTSLKVKALVFINKQNIMKKLTLVISFSALLFISLNAQEAKKAEIEAGLNYAYEPNMGNSGFKYYNRLNYPLSKLFKVHTSLGYFQSIFKFENTSSESNYSSLLLDADLDFVPFCSESGKSFSISAGLTYFRGALTYDGLTTTNSNGVKTVLNYQAVYNKSVGINAKLRYRVPISEKLYSTFNADVYFIETFSFIDILSFGYSIGYKF
jgi:hypothetical protein